MCHTQIPFKAFTPLKAGTNMSQVKNKKTFSEKKMGMQIFHTFQPTSIGS